MALSMALGAYLAGRRVTAVLAEQVTRLDHSEGLAANLATAALVGVAANWGWPVSTTHVSSGSIIGVGLRNGVQWQVVRAMALAWFVTLPLTGIMAAGVYCLFNLCGAAG